ncbi:Na+/H+ antiporter subunit E [Chloroflexota bacterium]
MSSGFKLRKAAKWNWNRLANVALQFAILLLLWLILSGHYEAKYISLGVLSAGLVTFLTNDLFYSLFARGGQGKISVRLAFVQLWHFLAYIPWLVSRIIKANIQVAYLVLHPKMPIDPVLLQYRTRLRRSITQVILANSITLTPGTVTVCLQDGRYLIHALVPSSAQDILEARMQNKVGAIFMEKKERPPKALWAYSLTEIEQ